ncbi:M23 family metallopeptidase [Desulfofalx alkaliphila]|uniref:M23 family metallopeptidase n=1 Tax=Desulfofalx alkaliphila TaxID=105483 RepID=UPI0004E17613|nr:M23 family metallopeptidase [Desulfofalx alkaliphila]
MLFKRTVYLLVLVLLMGCFSPAAHARLDEMIIKNKPYGVNRVNYQPETAPAGVSRSGTTVYRVKPGDTLWDLANRHGISVARLAAANGLDSESRLYVGQAIDLPGGQTSHTVKAGESIIAISQNYQVPVQELLRVNRISNPDYLQVGQTLTIPAAGAGPKAAAAAASGSTAMPFFAMDWPVKGRISSPFGIRDEGRPHHGVDIAADQGALIRAAQGGRVAYCGYYGDYGYTVIIDHGGGIRTLYAHCSALLVNSGQYVQKNDPIARVGNTGRSFGPHLHWEVQYQGVPFDPLLCIELNSYA